MAEAPIESDYKNGYITAKESNEKRFIVKYRQNFYDITKFIEKHPGGINTLKGLNNADMTARFFKAPPHSDAAMYLMKEYKLPPTKTKNLNGYIMETNMENDQQQEQKQEEKEFENSIEIIENTLEDKNNNINNNQLDESLEYLVDWSKAMLPQIPKITKFGKYDEWVHKPVDRPLRLFGPWYLEMCTKTSWWIIPLFWIPVIISCIKDEIFNSWRAANTSRLFFLACYFIIGILLWSLIEYSLHRWVFHMKTNGFKKEWSKWICTFHFMIHGLHHKCPFDSKRLVFPPVPGVVLASILYTPLSFVVPLPRFLLGGALFGYLCYDLMHYYLHYGNPSFKHFYNMKRYHYQHHFAHQDQGFGISSPLFDFVFNTRIKLRKLKFRLRWK